MPAPVYLDYLMFDVRIEPILIMGAYDLGKNYRDSGCSSWNSNAIYHDRR